MANDLFAKLSEQYPFITLCVYASNEYVGIIQNRDTLRSEEYTSELQSLRHPRMPSSA